MKKLEEYLNEVKALLCDSNQELTITLNSDKMLTYATPKLNYIVIDSKFKVFSVSNTEKLEKVNIIAINPVSDVKCGQVIGIEKNSGIPYFILLDDCNRTYITPVFKKDFDDIIAGKQELPSVVENDFQLFLFAIVESSIEINIPKYIELHLNNYIWISKYLPGVVMFSEPIGTLSNIVKIKTLLLEEIKFEQNCDYDKEIIISHINGKYGILKNNFIYLFDDKTKVPFNPDINQIFRIKDFS